VDLSAIEFLEKKTGVNIRGFAAVPSEVEMAITTSYEQGLSGEVSAALKENNPSESNTVETSVFQKEIKVEAPVARIVSKILEFAIKSRASDIHIEPSEENTRVRYRIDGILAEKLIVPKNIHESLVSRIKILAELKIDEKRIPQDGRFTFKQEMEEIDLRVSTLPTVNGEKVVMRLLSKTGGVPGLADLGLRGRALKNLEESVIKPHGIVLVTGPTGSGKTTTLYSVLSKINTTKVNIVTIEDPVEYQMTGVNQVQINPTAGLTFASALRSFLRQDPNIIMVGEIRDEETAALAVQASLTGHLVFSTLHTNSASGALPRLLDMKIEPYLLASSMSAIVGQRVARKLCSACRVEYAPVAEVIADIKKVLGALLPAGDIKLYKATGCSQCNDSGYVGRIGIFEVLPMNEKIARLTLERQPTADIERQAVTDGMIIMKQDGYLKSLEGVTTLEEVLRIAEE
jgi:type II secretory ATPase GspE/PulE/Tfp pilus assembly ATPase PilB-like protein